MKATVVYLAFWTAGLAYSLSIDSHQHIRAHEPHEHENCPHVVQEMNAVYNNMVWFLQQGRYAAVNRLVDLIREVLHKDLHQFVAIPPGQPHVHEPIPKEEEHHLREKLDCIKKHEFCVPNFQNGLISILTPTTIAPTTIPTTTQAPVTTATTVPTVKPTSAQNLTQAPTVVQTTTRAPYQHKTTSVAPISATSIRTVTKPSTQYPMCNAMDTMHLAITGNHVTHPDAGVCPDGLHRSPEALVLGDCGAPDIAQWHMGQFVMIDCVNIPLYTPVGKFVYSTYTQSPRTVAGVFLGCTQDGFKMAVQPCGEPVKIVELRSADPDSELDADLYSVIMY